MVLASGWMVERFGASGAAVRSGSAQVVLAGLGAFAVVVGSMWLWWPLGVAVGLVLGIGAVLIAGRAMQRAALAVPADGLSALTEGVDLPAEFRRLRGRVGEDWPDFCRAAMLVVGMQWATVAALQRDLRVTTAHAQHLMRLLETEGFVGPSRGNRPRVVRLPRERSIDLQRLLHA